MADGAADGSRRSSRADEFVRLFNRLTEYLRKTTGLHHSRPFHELVARAADKNPAIRNNESLLRDYSELRNAIVHYRSYPTEYVAEPTEKTLARFRRLVDAVSAPRRLIPAHRRTIRVFREDEPFLVALKYMDEMDFSQVVVRRGAEHRLLTAEGMTEWLKTHAKVGVVDLEDVTVGQVHDCEKGEKSAVLARNNTVFDALELFSESTRHKGPRIYAVLITHSGKRTEKPLGIVTAWDVLKDAGEML